MASGKLLRQLINQVLKATIMAFAKFLRLLFARFKVTNLSLLGKDFDRKEEYSLVTTDGDTEAELSRYRVVIDLTFRGDFG